MSLVQQLKTDLATAMKAKDSARTSTLRLIRAEVLQLEKSGAGTPDDDAVIAALNRMLKQRHDSARQYEEGNRPDLAEQEHAEAAIIEHYLPRSLSTEEMQAIVDDVLAATGADSPADMGRVMGQVMTRARQTGQRVDGAALNQLVKQRLGA